MIQVIGMQMILCGAMGYLLGSINPAYIFGKLRGFDIRNRGSGNAGATNVTLIMGKAAGLLCALLDIFKSFIAYRLAKALFPLTAFAGVLAGCACILGHIFPVWMGFAGGKGLACIGGLILAYDWKLFLILLAIEIVLVLLTQYICVVALSACVLFPIIYAMQTGDAVGTMLLCLLIPVVYYKHLPNLKRIMEKREARISWLWNAEAEEKRLQGQFDEQEWKKIYRKANHK